MRPCGALRPPTAAPSEGAPSLRQVPVDAAPPVEDQVLLGDNLALLPRFADASFTLVYLDPPFNTGRRRTRRTLATVSDAQGDRSGFAGRRYRTTVLSQASYGDRFDDYPGFLEPRLREAHRLMAADGTLYLHL